MLCKSATSTFSQWMALLYLNYIAIDGSCFRSRIIEAKIAKVNLPLVRTCDCNGVLHNQNKKSTQQQNSSSEETIDLQISNFYFSHCLALLSQNARFNFGILRCCNLNGVLVTRTQRCYEGKRMFTD
ncbi:hypothetical protein Tsp_05071 [Trichinella spiralis]|uniref:hypothetical protein n=1 Tax=Trichinella spiralis TaxID=6334 RepID=UPI0001EFECFD|nr:hypothetical protein Tsp_05071 [Trichinella spiralis]